MTVETSVTPGWLGLVFPNKEEDKPVVDGNRPSHHHTITPSHHHTGSIYSSCPATPDWIFSLGICNSRPYARRAGLDLTFPVMAHNFQSSLCNCHLLPVLELHLLPATHKVTLSIEPYILLITSLPPTYFLSAAQAISLQSDKRRNISLEARSLTSKCLSENI